MILQQKVQNLEASIPFFSVNRYLECLIWNASFSPQLNDTFNQSAFYTLNSEFKHFKPSSTNDSLVIF